MAAQVSEEAQQRALAVQELEMAVKFEQDAVSERVARHAAIDEVHLPLLSHRC